MTSNDSDATVEGTHMTTPHEQRTPALTIPASVKELTIRRPSVFYEGDEKLSVNIKGDYWSMAITTTDAEVLTRIHEVAAAMEAVK